MCKITKKILTLLVLEKEIYGGQILKADKVKNYPGFKEISGYEFANNLYNQLTNLDVKIKFEEAIEIIGNNISLINET